MCGIAGYFTPSTLTASSVLENMTRALTHRGPDDHGYFGMSANGESKAWEKEGLKTLTLGLGHRRLSILDPSPNGHQPMTTSDGRYTICFNGEIYNFIELYDELVEFNFRSRSDTEVLLNLWAKFGEECVDKINGIFAFALFDKHREELWLVRDHLGVKPLYYFQDLRGLFFASEIRALLKALTSKPKLRTSLLSRYLMANWIPDPDTLFEGIFKLEPGHLLRINKDGAQKKRYWDLNYHPDNSLSLSSWESQLGSSLERVVDRQMRSDVPLAFFLSGGVDSSLLAVTAAKKREEAPTTYTIGFRWSDSKKVDDDVLSARLLKDKFNFDYREIFVEPSIVSLMPKIIDALEEPVADPAAICSYLICQEASKEFKVLISGQGGDELFGGYPVYQGGQAAKFLQRFPGKLVDVVSFLMARFPYSLMGNRLQAVHRIKKLLTSSQRPWPEPFMALRSALHPKDLQPVLGDKVIAEQLPPYARHLDHYRTAKQWDYIQQMLYLDTKTYLPSTNLTYTDKTSMAHSVEVRVPFLDKELLDLVARVPTKYKAKLNQSKILLKLFSRQVLPREVIYRKKAGFGLPLRDWFLKDLQPMADDLLSASRLERQKLFEPSTPQRWLKEHRERSADHSAKIYSLLTFQLWTEQFGVRV